MIIDQSDVQWELPGIVTSGNVQGAVGVENKQRGDEAEPRGVGVPEARAVVEAKRSVEREPAGVVTKKTTGLLSELVGHVRSSILCKENLGTYFWVFQQRENMSVESRNVVHIVWHVCVALYQPHLL